MDYVYNFNYKERKLLNKLKDKKFLFIIGQGGTCSRFVTKLIKKMGVYIGHDIIVNKEKDSILFNKYYEKIKKYINNISVNKNKLDFEKKIQKYIMKELLLFFKEYYEFYDNYSNSTGKKFIYQSIKLNSIVYFIDLLKIIIPQCKIIYLKRDFMYLTKKNITYGRKYFPLDCSYLAKKINPNNKLVPISSTNLQEKMMWRIYEYEYIIKIAGKNLFIFDTDNYFNNEEIECRKLHQYLDIYFDKSFINKGIYLDRERYYKPIHN